MIMKNKILATFSLLGALAANTASAVPYALGACDYVSPSSSTADLTARGQCLEDTVMIDSQFTYLITLPSNRTIRISITGNGYPGSAAIIDGAPGIFIELNRCHHVAISNDLETRLEWQRGPSCQ